MEQQLEDGEANISVKKPLIRKEEGHKFKSGFVFFSTLIVAMGPLTYGFAIGYSSPTQLNIESDLSISISQFSLFGSLITVGGMVGAILSGTTAEVLGRRGALAVSAVPVVIGWFSVAVTQGVGLLYVGRFLVGFGIGISSFTVPIYIAEIAPHQLRGMLGTMNQLFISIGIMLVYLGGLLMNWRLLSTAGAIPGVLMVIGLFFIPETPRWLAKAGLKDQLYTSLQKLRGEDHDVTEEAMDIQEAVEIFKLQPKAKLSDLFKRQIFYPLLAGIGLLLFQQLSGINAVMLYAGQIFREVGISSSNAASFGLGSLQVLMTIVTAGLVERAGRRILLMVSAGGMAFSSSLVGLSFYLKDIAGDEISPDMSTCVGLLAIFGLLVYIISYSLGMGPVPWIVMGEILPARVRGTAGSLAILISWFSAWVVTLTFNFILEWSAPGSFWIFAAICVSNVIFVAFFVPETRGRTLEEIEASFK
ncbi:sugar transporter ERD6-like 4 isoform X2 [Cryptomeria japonica]|uniref:sugar transporter ERD6-like 4 isoform X2 n=1 Tax=Cryptomeria japonica TaxID=3369 RepID=UPI0025AC8603|nr:sugar transporter ERD6-like 4 isoform X2 [Cryptomeria japonica]